MNTYKLNDILNFIFTDKKSAIQNLQKNGLLLEDLSEELKRDKEVVLTAIINNPKSFKFASDELKADPQIVLEAILINPQNADMVLWHADRNLVEMIGRNEPISYLKALTLKKMLSTSLKVNSTQEEIRKV